MYQVAIYLYLCGVAVASIFSKKVRKMWKDERQVLDILKSKVNPNHRYIWFHAASLGEFEQGWPLIKRTRADYPEYKILLTFFSPSGYEVRKNYEHADVVCYLSIDAIRDARRFLRTVRPCMAFFIKHEFWHNYLHILKHRNVPIYSVSSIFREHQIFFRWYGKSYADVLRCFTHFFVQNEKSKHLLHTLGIDTVDVVGDTCFDRVLQIKEKVQQLSIVEAFRADKKVSVVGSSRAPGEDIFIPFMNEYRGWKMIIAPHVISREHLKRIEEKRKGKTVCYTAITPEEAAQAQYLLIDCSGLLSSVYHHGEVAYVDGGFGVGIHNVLEAVVWNMSVFFGPNHQCSQEAQELIKVKGGFEITGSSSFARIIQQFTTQQEYLQLSGEVAGSYVEPKAGATHKILKQIDL